jgi:hypothetical protein
MKKYVLGWMTLLAIAVWAGNYMYYERHTLAEPVFLDHAYAFTPFPGAPISLYNITHRDEPRELLMVQPSDEIKWPVQANSIYGDYGPYRLNKATILIGDPERPLSPEIYQTFTELKAWFRQGNPAAVSVGRIILRPPAGETPNSLLMTVTGTDRSSGEFEHVMEAREDLRVLAVSHTLESELGERLTFSVRKTLPEQDGVPLEMKQGESLTVQQRIGEQAGPTDKRMIPMLGELTMELQPAGQPERRLYWRYGKEIDLVPGRQGIEALVRRKGRGMADGG